MFAGDSDSYHQVKACSKFEIITLDIYVESVQSQKERFQTWNRCNAFFNVVITVLLQVLRDCLQIWPLILNELKRIKFF